MISAANATPACELLRWPILSCSSSKGLPNAAKVPMPQRFERVPLILQSHPDVWALVPDPVRLKSPVARPVLRIGQLRAVQRAAAYFQPMGRRRVFILDNAETMRWDVASVFLKILEEPPGNATLILTASSPFALLPTIISRCMQFHLAPLPQAEVESVLKAHSDRKPAEIKLAAQLSEGSPRPGHGDERRG